MLTVQVVHHAGAGSWRRWTPAVLAMGGLTFGVIVAGDRGFGAPEVLAALAVAVVALALFMAVAVFGALLADRAHVLGGLRESLLIAAAVAFAAAAANLRRRPAPRR